jgi:predicted type IV restriction endonuclease
MLRRFWKHWIAILTNGVQYWFYPDLEEPNKMDEKPFLELDLANSKPAAFIEVQKMAKDGFDLDRMLSTASELKYTSEIKKILATQASFWKERGSQHTEVAIQ